MNAPRAMLGVPLDPVWPETLTLLSDSVGTSSRQGVAAALPGWKVEVLGRPALMVKQVVPEFLNARGVGTVVVVALGYNSLFEKDRKIDEQLFCGRGPRSQSALVVLAILLEQRVVAERYGRPPCPRLAR